jgi:hypothetical protein
MPSRFLPSATAAPARLRTLDPSLPGGRARSGGNRRRLQTLLAVMRQRTIAKKARMRGGKQAYSPA